jgi:sulfite exporter TauE/SafE
MMVFLTGVLLGVAGSGHCIGMCGPLVLTFGRTAASGSWGPQLRHSALYHAGRVATYCLLAIPAGLMGGVVSTLGLGRALSVLAALLLIAVAAGWSRPGLPGGTGRHWSPALVRAGSAAIRFSHGHPIAAPVVTGALNGLLPCGLVYVALAAAAAAGTAMAAVAFMAGFGLGTLPALLAVTASARVAPSTLRARLRRVTPIVLVLTAMLLILRAVMNPGSPEHHAAPPATIAHH